jgi:hypothetical protein
MDTGRTDKKTNGRGRKKDVGANERGEISLLTELIDLMIQKKVLHLKKDNIELVLSPLAFQPDLVMTNDGNSAENIDELLYIKKPKNGFPKF